MTPTLTLTSASRYATQYHLWALGVGTVISGYFFGWQTLLAGGWGGAVLTWGLVTILYTCLTMSIAEIASALPRAGVAPTPRGGGP